jgi:POLQ-like helicase
MRPSRRARFAAAITLSKGKMYEYGVPVEEHLQLPDGLNLELQFPLALGTLGDFAAEVVSRAIGRTDTGVETQRSEVIFAAQVLQAFDDSRLQPSLSFELRLLAAAAFYLGDVPGSATVLINGLSAAESRPDDLLAAALQIALGQPWRGDQAVRHGAHVSNALSALRAHFLTGDGVAAAQQALLELRRWSYASGTAHELLLADILGAVVTTRINKSAWTLLPRYTGLPLTTLQPYLERPKAIKEMWPSQRMLGDAGLYRGESAVVQMPTSAGKTRATELILRAAFASGRTNLAVVVAPFRALCHEIANDLKTTFGLDGYEVNQLSDALQPDFTTELFGFFDVFGEPVPHVVVLTPEKLLYVLRQEQEFVGRLGLIVYDEGHQFDTGTRGVTYELLLTSIKRALPENAQTVLVSAVVRNVADIARWLLSDEEKVVADRWLQTRRLVAFASLPAGFSGQLQFSAAFEGEQAFFVPRVIVRESLKRRRGESKERVFPTDESGSLALYLGLRLVPNGGVAIYARMKSSAAKIVRDAVEETFTREPSLSPPSAVSNPNEIERLVYLFEKNFGAESYLTKGAALGLFVHHGNTPHGLRLAIEHAMREDYIRFIVCTSTLAQGVNLPIRYLLVTSTMQGRDAIKARDFHNLIGRAGRAGMYGEGTVLFTDASLYDGRIAEPDRWAAAQNLLKAESAAPTGSTLLELLEPMKSDNGRQTLETLSPFDFATRLIDTPEEAYRLVDNLSASLVRRGFSTEQLRRQLNEKRSAIEAVESFLMTYRGIEDSDSFVATSRSLGRETFAYSLGTPEQQGQLEDIFERVAHRIERLVPDTATQARYGKSLFGVDKSISVDKWVKEHLFELALTNSSDELLEVIWPLMLSLSVEKKLKLTEPRDAIQAVAKGWLAGESFKTILANLNAENAYIQQKSTRKKFDVDAVVSLCEHTFGYEFSLYIASMKASFLEQSDVEESTNVVSEYADLLQKRLKYGLPSQESIAYFEAGFAERVVAQDLALALLWEVAKTSAEASVVVRHFPEDVEPVLAQYPSYFRSVYERMVS